MKPFLIGILSLAFFTAHADLPVFLVYKEKPFDSLCLYEAGNSQGTADLTQCGLHNEAERRVTGQNNKLIDEGFIGYDYAWKIDETSEAQGYSYYKFYGMVDDAALVWSLNNSGGTGQFSSISLITRNDDQIKVQAYNSGDRCNNGIVGVKKVSTESGARLIYSINLTAFDFLTLAEDNPHQLMAYDDLESCAACCKAVAVFERSLDKDFSKEKLLHVDLSAYPIKEGVVEERRGRDYQSCFDKLLQDYKKKYRNKLEPGALKAFTDQFNSECIKH